MSDIRQAALLAASRVGNVTLLDTRGNLVPGTTDMTAAWETAMAGGGTVCVPEGTYLLSGCDIPTDQGDITIQPLGQVTIKWAPTAGSQTGAALRWDGTGNASAAITVDTVTNDDDWPSSSDGPVTKIEGSAGDFDGWSMGDVGHLMSDDITYDGFIKGEFFKVNYVAPDTSYIYCDRQLFHTYDAGANTTVVRRFTSTPKLTIKKGITITPTDDPSSVLSFRPWGMYIIGAVEPEIDIEFSDCYNICIEMRGIYGGTVRLKQTYGHVDYSVSAFGYGVELYGSVYGTTLYLDGNSCGHLIAPNGLMTTYLPNSWWYAGVPDMLRVPELHGRDCRRSPLDTHWCYRAHFGMATVSGAIASDTSQDNSDVAATLGGVGITIDTLICRNVRAGVTIRNHRGVTTTHTIGRLDYRNAGKPYIAGVFGQAIATQDASTNLVVEVLSGYVELPGSGVGFPLNISVGGSDDAVRIVMHNTVFKNCDGLVRYSAARPVRFDLHNFVFDAGDGGGDNSLVRYNVNIDNYVRLFSGAVITNSSNDPDGVVRAAAGVTCTTTIGTILSDDGAIAEVSSSSSGTATENITRINALRSATSSGTTGGAGSAGAGNQFVELTIGGTTYKVLHDGTV